MNNRLTNIADALMRIYKVGVITGDGISPDVIAWGVKALNAVATLDGIFAFELIHYPWDVNTT